MGLTAELLRELDLPQFEDAETARRYLEGQAWPDGVVCPHCGSQEWIYRLSGCTTRPGLHSCKACHGQFTVTTKTQFHSTHIPLHKWLLATAALEKTPSTCAEIGDAIGVTYKTAWRMRSVIRPDLLRVNRCATGRREQFLYPFLTSARQTPEHEMLKAVSAAVPHGIPHDRRADICQELVLSILIGDIQIADLPRAVNSAFTKVYKQHPTTWAPLSLDAPIPGTDDLFRIDTISEDHNIWDR